VLTKKLLVAFGIMISLTAFINSYTAPTYNDIDFDLCAGYTAPAYNNIDFTLGLLDSCTTDSCSYSSGDWIINCADNCTIIDNVNLALNNIIFTGAGHFAVQSNITNIGRREISNGCQIWIYENSRF
jgi:hypothetical protein